MTNKKVMYKDKNLNTITDFDTLDKFRNEYVLNFGHKNNGVLYLSPKTDIERKIFQTEFMRQQKSQDTLQNNSLLKKLFPNYKTMKLEIYVSDSFDGLKWYTFSLIEKLKGRTASFIELP